MVKKYPVLTSGAALLLVCLTMAGMAGFAVAGSAYSLYSLDGTTVSAVDPATGAVLKTVDTGLKGGSINDMAFSPNGKLYVTSMIGSIGDDRNEIAVIDLSEMKLSKKITLDVPNPEAMAMGPGGLLYVATGGSGSPDSSYTGKGAIVIIDTATDKVVQTIDAREAYDIAIVGNYAYVTNDNDNAVSVLDLGTRQIVKTIDLPGMPMFITPGKGGKLYVRLGSVAVIDTATNSLTGTVRMGDTVWLLAGSENGNVFASTWNKHEIEVIDAATDNYTATIPLDNGVISLAVAPDGMAYASYNSPGNGSRIAVIDPATNTVIRTLMPYNYAGSTIAFGPAQATAGSGATATPATAGGSSTPATPTKTPGFELAAALIGIGTIVIAQRMKR